jgi:hypothetical protein
MGRRYEEAALAKAIRRGGGGGARVEREKTSADHLPVI